MPGFERVEGFDQIAADGVARQVLLGGGSSGGASEEEARVPLGVEELRGFGSPPRVTGKGKEAAFGSSPGDKDARNGPAKKRKNAWVKSKQAGNYDVGEDVAWSTILTMSKQTLVGKVVG